MSVFSLVRTELTILRGMMTRPGISADSNTSKIRIIMAGKIDRAIPSFPQENSCITLIPQLSTLFLPNSLGSLVWSSLFFTSGRSLPFEKKPA